MGVVVIGARVDLVRWVGVDRLGAGWFGRESILRGRLIYRRFALHSGALPDILPYSIPYNDAGRQVNGYSAGGTAGRISQGLRLY